MPKSPRSPRLWFAFAGAPIAWGIQLTAGYWLTQADCSAAGRAWGIALDTATIALGAGALALALSAGVAALALTRATAEASGEPPAGRVRFMAVVGLAITPLFAAMIVLSTVGVAVLEPCHPS